MPTEITFGKQKVIEPGVRSQILSGIKNPPLSLSYGNILIIDTGSGATWGAGAGTTGTLTVDKKDAIQSFDNLNDYRRAMKGGILWLVGKWLFQPENFSVPGVSMVNYIRAATTVAAEMSYVFTGGGANGGTMVLQIRDEGLIGNGQGNIDDETLAEGSILITVAGGAGDTIEMTSDEGAGAVSLGEYTVINLDAVGDVATGLAAAINLLTATHGYVAVAATATVTITPPAQSGVAANSYTLAAVKTGTVTGTITAFAGGVNGTLTKGYGMKMRVSPTDSTKYIIDYYVGTFRGLDVDSESYDFIDEVDTTPYLLVSSVEFNTFAVWYAWATTSAEFLRYFAIKTYTPAGTGAVDAADLAANGGWVFGAGGTETYGAADLLDVFEAITEVDYTFILADKYNTDAQHATLTSILNHIINESKYGEMMVVGARNLGAAFATSLTDAAYYDSERVIVVHAGLKKLRRDGTGFKEYPSIVKAAAVLGRIAGLEPQVPLTFKGIDMDGDSHNMTESERKTALKGGLLHTKYDYEFAKFTVNQGINSIQNNINMVNEDGTSAEISIMRIAAQLNKEIIYNAKRQLLGQTYGVNRNTLSSLDVKNWIEGYLQRRTATGTVDNLILSFENVVVVTNQDSYEVTYGFVPNFPVNKLFFTGFMLDPETK